MYPEIEDGNIEYKRKFSKDIIDSLRMETLITQMKWRIKEGSGLAYYYLGVNDNGSIYSMNRQEVKDTIYIFKLLVDKANVKILEISRHNISKKEFYFKITIQNIYEMNNDNFF
jgi:GTPase